MTYPTFLDRLTRRGPEIRCVFPECPTHWIFGFGRPEAEIEQHLAETGWCRVEAIETSLARAWGWACSEPTNHFIGGDTRRQYSHTKESAHV